MNTFSSPKQEVRNISYVLEASLGVENTAINKTNVVSAHIAHGQDARQVDFPFFPPVPTSLRKAISHLP